MYTYEKYHFRMFTLLMAVLAFGLLVYTEYVLAFGVVLVGVALSFSYQGVKIDPDQRRYLKYDRFLWLRIGRWVSMSVPSYVTIVRINLSSRRSLPLPLVPPDERKEAKTYKVNLVVEGEERYISICRGPLKDMTSEALRLGKHLNLRVLDFSTPEKKWIYLP